MSCQCTLFNVNEMGILEINVVGINRIQLIYSQPWNGVFTILPLSYLQ